MTTPATLNVLILEDSEMDELLILRALGKGGYDVTHERVFSAEAMRDAMARRPWDIILSDHNMPGFNSLAALEIFKESGLDIPFIIISAAIGEETAVAAMKAGASDYLMKDKLARLVPAVDRELKEAQGRAAKRQAQEDLLRTQEELRASNELLKAYTTKLEQSNQELEHFAAIVSHDLQAPLRKVIMFTDFLADQERDRLSDESQDYMARIQKAVTRMQQLVSDLLALSRVTRKPLASKPIHLQGVLDTVLEDLQPVILATQGTVVFSADPQDADALSGLEGDKTQIGQLLQNLIENALKFHREDVPPQVRISARVLDECFFQIKVADNGIGFKSEFADKIFDVFQRLHGVDTYEGTGIGLAIVRKIVERHNGTIATDSEPNVGSVFTVTLPLRQNGGQTAPASFPTAHLLAL